MPEYYRVGGKDLLAGGTTPTFIGARAYLSTEMSPGTSSAAAVIADTMAYDTSGFHAPSITPQRTFLIPVGLAGWYGVYAQALFVGNATGLRSVALYRVNTAGAAAAQSAIQVNAGGTGEQGVAAYSEINCSEGEALYFTVWQNSGGALGLMTGTFNTFMLIHYLGS